MKHILFLVLMALWLAPPALAEEDVYQSPQEFVSEAFNGSPPEPQVFSIAQELRPAIDAIMEHAYPVTKTQFWTQGKRSAWVLEEIGKYKPITAGIIIDQDKIEQVKVLIYRESHGWQVRHAFFTDQFKGAMLGEDHALSQPVDNISGATMSVDALRNLGRLALYLSQHVHSHP
jgi:hypothetical protein